jgi:hypothetical protein
LSRRHRGWIDAERASRIGLSHPVAAIPSSTSNAKTSNTLIDDLTLLDRFVHRTARRVNLEQALSALGSVRTSRGLPIAEVEMRNTERWRDVPREPAELACRAPHSFADPPGVPGGLLHRVAE